MIETALELFVLGLTVERFSGATWTSYRRTLRNDHSQLHRQARGIFEFIRFDQNKPGILKKLGPITNDVIGGLIAGVSSNMYTKALERISRANRT